MAKIKWTCKGGLQFVPQLSEVETSYGNPVPLAGVRVLLEGKEIAADPTWDNWGEDVTSASGGFRITNDKDRSPRMFRLRVMFKDDDLKIYPPSTGIISRAIDAITGGSVVSELAEEPLEQAIAHVSRLTYDVDWFTVHQDDKDHKQGPGVVDFGSLTFASGGRHDLGDRTARRHAEIWFTCRLVMRLLSGAGSGLGFPKGKPVAVLHPHDNPLINDRIEQSLASPGNDVAFLVENSHVDGFDVGTIIHELMHLWTYQRVHGENALAWQAIIHGGTHDGLQRKTWVPFFEAVAEWSTHQLHRVVFGDWPLTYGGSPTGSSLPFTRSFLKGKGVTVLQDVDRSEWGWMSLFGILRNPDIATLDTSGTGDRVPSNVASTSFTPQGQPMDPPGVGGDEPTFLDVLNVLNEHPTQGVLGRSDMELEPFIDRALAIMPQHPSSEKSEIIELLNPRPDVQPGPPRKPQEPKPQALPRQAPPGGRPASTDKPRKPAGAGTGGHGQPSRSGKAGQAGAGKAGSATKPAGAGRGGNGQPAPAGRPGTRGRAGR